MIGKFLAGLTEVQKKMLAVAVGLFVIVLFDRLLISPTISKLSSIDQNIATEEGLIKRDVHFLKQKDKILEQSKAAEVYITKDLPAEEEMIAAFLKTIEDLASQAKVTLVKVTPVGGQQEKDYLKYQADLECTGQLADVISFMHLVNTSKDLLKIVKFNLGGKKSEANDVKATMTISKIVVPSKPLADKLPVEQTAGSQKVAAGDKASAASQ